MSASLQSRERVHQIISDQLVVLLASRGEEKTICPSKVVRSVDTDLPDGWRAEMPTVRGIAYSMARAGKLSVLQRGEVQDVSTLEELRGPIRLRKMGCVKEKLSSSEQADKVNASDISIRFGRGATYGPEPTVSEAHSSQS